MRRSLPIGVIARSQNWKAARVDTTSECDSLGQNSAGSGQHAHCSGDRASSPANRIERFMQRGAAGRRTVRSPSRRRPAISAPLAAISPKAVDPLTNTCVSMRGSSVTIALSMHRAKSEARCCVSRASASAKLNFGLAFFNERSSSANNALPYLRGVSEGVGTVCAWAPRYRIIAVRAATKDQPDQQHRCGCMFRPRDVAWASQSKLRRPQPECHG